MLLRLRKSRVVFLDQTKRRFSGKDVSPGTKNGYADGYMMAEIGASGFSCYDLTQCLPDIFPPPPPPPPTGRNSIFFNVSKPITESNPNSTFKFQVYYDIMTAPIDTEINRAPYAYNSLFLRPGLYVWRIHDYAGDGYFNFINKSGQIIKQIRPFMAWWENGASIPDNSLNNAFVYIYGENRTRESFNYIYSNNSKGIFKDISGQPINLSNIDSRTDVPIIMGDDNTSNIIHFAVDPNHYYSDKYDNQNPTTDLPLNHYAIDNQGDITLLFQSGKTYEWYNNRPLDCFFLIAKDLENIFYKHLYYFKSDGSYIYQDISGYEIANSKSTVTSSSKPLFTIFDTDKNKVYTFDFSTNLVIIRINDILGSNISYFPYYNPTFSDILQGNTKFMELIKAVTLETIDFYNLTTNKKYEINLIATNTYVGSGSFANIFFYVVRANGFLFITCADDKGAEKTSQLYLPESIPLPQEWFLYENSTRNSTNYGFQNIQLLSGESVMNAIIIIKPDLTVQIEYITSPIKTDFGSFQVGNDDCSYFITNDNNAYSFVSPSTFINYSNLYSKFESTYPASHHMLGISNTFVDILFIGYKSNTVLIDALNYDIYGFEGGWLFRKITNNYLEIKIIDVLGNLISYSPKITDPQISDLSKSKIYFTDQIVSITNSWLSVYIYDKFYGTIVNYPLNSDFELAGAYYRPSILKNQIPVPI